MLPILFLIYLSGVFIIIKAAAPAVTSLSFINNLGFIFKKRSAKNIVIILKLINKAVI